MSSDEAKLLASVGGVVEDMTKYEEEVIQKAQLETAPKLDGHGFPPLAPLEPSYAPSSGSSSRGDIPHFHTIFKIVKKELTSIRDKESRRAKVLRIKEQLILASLEQTLKKDEMPISLYEEIDAEQKRIERIMQKRGKSESSDFEQVQNAKKKKSNGSYRSDEMKNGDRGDPGDELSLTAPQAKRPRKTMMNWKQRSKGGSSADIGVELKEKRKRLREMRIERQKVRRERLAIIEPKKYNDSSSEDEAEFHDETEAAKGAACLTQKLEGTNIVDLSGESGGGQDFDNSCIMGRKSQDIVECPICGAKVNIFNGNDQDAVLAEHISTCQNRDGPRTRRRSSGREKRDILYTQEIELEDRPKRRRMTTQQERASNASSSIFTPSSSFPALDDMNEECYEDRVDDWIENGLSKMKVMMERDQNEVSPGAVELPGGLIIPAWINDRLFPYQRLGVRWMWELHQQKAGGIIGDEMGLGKTVQVCSFLSSMAANRKLKSALIVCPATVLQHWLKELSVWSPGLRRILCHKSGETDGLSRKVTPTIFQNMSSWLKQSRSMCLNEAIDEKDFEEFNPDIFVGTGYVFVTTYENIRRSPDVWINHRWSYVILDEGQKIRNPDADVTLTCKKLRTPHRLLLSGTPIQNDLKELWTLFDFVFPGRLGTLPAFESEFGEPIKKGGYSNASPMVVQLAFRCALVLKDLINPYLLRRQKKDIKEVSRMPGKTEQVLFCRLSKRQRDLYEAYLRSDEVSNILRGSPQLLRSITILRKICNHPDLVCDPNEESYEQFVRNGFNQIPDSFDSDQEEKENEDLDDLVSMTDRSGKMQVLAKILPLWQKQGHRVLIFCQWTKMLDILQKFMMNNGWKFGRLDGKTSVSSRQRLIDTFNSDESYFAMLMTTRTGGVGVNLTGANRVVIYDPDWNPQTDSQARARSHRFGQTKPVTIYRLITAGTIEEKIYHRQIFKTALTNKVLEDPKQKRLFSQKDLRDFFTLKADDGSIISGDHGVTELGTITRGQGVITPEEVLPNTTGDEVGSVDDKETLVTVMKSQGLAGIFDHDFVDSSASKKTISILEMEEKARKVAQEAAKVLEESARNGAGRFQPTWTGSNEISTGRFGHGRTIPVSGLLHQQNGEARNYPAAGVTQKAAGSLNSKSLLLGLNRINSGDQSKSIDVEKYSQLLQQLGAFVRRCGGSQRGGGPTTDEILAEFKDVPTSDAAIFRRLLTRVAKNQNGKWRIKNGL